MRILYGGTLLPKIQISLGNHRRLGSMNSTMKIKAKIRMRYNSLTHHIFVVGFLWFAV
jgi:hypothetical protein